MYVVAVPDSTEWLVVVYDVLSGDGTAAKDPEYDQFVSALIAMFDGIMSTFRWTFNG